MNGVHLILSIAGLLISALLFIALLFNLGALAELEAPERGLGILMMLLFCFYHARELMGAAIDKHEHEADTKIPSDNGAEPFGKRDTTAYLIDKGRNSRW